MKKINILFASVVIAATAASSQTLIWNDTLGGSSNWTVNVSIGPNVNMSDLWVLDDMEGGMVPPQCQVMLNGNATLHVTSPMAMGGAIYASNIVANKRAMMSNGVSTMGYSMLNLKFDWVGYGIPNADYAELMYSIDGGSSWTSLGKYNSASWCGNKFQWMLSSVNLPAACANKPDFRIAFDWHNNGDGTGSNPSFAVNNIRLYGYTSTGINELSSEVSLYEGNGGLFIHSDKPVVVLAATDLLGRSISFSSDGKFISFSEKFNGIYFITLETDSRIVTRKILVR